MPRKSSIHFKPVTNVRFAVSHSERTDLSEPSYLLPKEHQLPNTVVTGSLPENSLSALFIQQKEGMTGQAKARASSPFWEGVVVLSNTNSQEQSANLQVWKSAYEKETGHKVLHMSVHLDEGYVDTHGKPQYNPHAHVIVSRMDEKNRVISLGRKQLANVQDLTAETLQMQRGSTLTERGGKRGRKHIPHREFRAQADEKRLGLDKSRADLVRLNKLSMEWSATDLVKIKDLEKELAAAQIHIIQQAAEIVQLNEQYRRDREAFKASGEAKQADYQKLKIKHEADLEKLEKELVTAQVQATKVPQLEAQINALEPEAAKVQGLEKQVTDARQDVSNKSAEIARINIQYQLDRDEFKRQNAEAVAAGLEKVKLQQDYQALKKDHEAALAKLTSAETQAGKVPNLEEQLKVSQEQRAKVQGLAAQAIQQASQLAQLNDQYQTLKESGEARQANAQFMEKTHEKALADLTKAQTEAEKVSGLEAQINLIKPLANAVPELVAKLKTVNEQVGKMDEYTKNLNAQLAASNEKIALELIAKAKAIEALVQAGVKSEELLVTSKGHRAAAEKLTGELAASEEKVTKLTTDLAASNKLVQEFKQARIDKPNLPAPIEVLKAVDTILINQAKERLKTPSEPLKNPTAPSTNPTPEKSFSERLGASLMAMLDWIKTIGAEQEPVTASSEHRGPVKHMDHLHCIQKTSRTRYAIHQLAHLDNIPALDDPTTEIQYRGGFGQVVGKLGQKPER